MLEAMLNQILSQKFVLKDYLHKQSWWQLMLQGWQLYGVGLIVIVSLVLLGLGAISFGLIQIISQSNQQSVAGVDDGQSCQLFAEDKQFGQIWVDVSGEVVSPGLYELKTNSKVADIINQAGGFSPEVDKVYVQQQLNLAQELKNGDKIFIPSQENVEIAAKCERYLSSNLVTQSKDEKQALRNAAVTGLISINNASQSELETLPGIGEKRATDIIENRPFVSVDELVSKEVITESALEKIKSMISI